MKEVKKEIYGFRDEEISIRHRKWGVGCPAVDIDFAMLEFNYGEPVAIVEYKHSNIKKSAKNWPINLKHPVYTAISKLADNSNIPFLVAVYDPEMWFFEIIPVNEMAVEFYKDQTQLTEKRFVKSLYVMRGKSLNNEDNTLLERLNTQEAA